MIIRGLAGRVFVVRLFDEFSQQLNEMPEVRFVGLESFQYSSLLANAPQVIVDFFKIGL